MTKRCQMICLLALLILLSVSSAVEAQTAEEFAAGAYPDLAVDRKGGLHLVYVRDGRLYYRTRPQAREDWSAEESTGLEAGLVQRSDPEIVIDSKGRPHVLVGSSYAWKDGRRWRAVDPHVKRDTGLAIDSRDNVYVVRRGGHGRGFLGMLRRRAGAPNFEALPDPDVAAGYPTLHNDHVYPHLAVSPRDDSLHVVYRHGTPKRAAYRVSTDGGRSWYGAGIADDDREAPSLALSPAGTLFAVTGRCKVFRRDGAAEDWSYLGHPIDCARRDLPVLSAAGEDELWVAAHGGRLGVLRGGAWTQEKTLTSPNGDPVGYVDLAASEEGEVYAAWEAGDALSQEHLSGTGAIFVSRVRGRSSVQVPKYGRFEASLRNAREYSDPFRDVALTTRFRSPSGRVVEFWGFYDGGDVWRVRFRPEEVGRWEWAASFSDGSPGGSGVFDCVEGGLPGPIGVHRKNPVWFGRSGGPAVLIRGFHIGDRFFAANWGHEKREEFLDWIEGQGYNLLSIASHYLNRPEPGRGRGWRTPWLWPLNPAEYRKMEAILDGLAARGIVVYPFAGFFGKNSNYPRDPAGQELYIRYTLARIAPYGNLLFNTAGPEPNLRQTWMESEEVVRLGKLIKALDPFEHAISVHNRTGDDPYRDSDWTDYGILQGPKSVDQQELSRGLLRNHHPAKPLLAQETLWSGNQFHIRRHGGYSDEALRKNAYVMTMSAAMIVFADNQGNSSSGFSGTLDLGDRRQERHDILRRVWDFFEMIPFAEMKPFQDAVDFGYCLAKDGERYLVYLPAGGEVEVRLRGGPYRGEWINARATTDRRATGDATGTTRFRAPDGKDWLLYLVR